MQDLFSCHSLPLIQITIDSLDSQLLHVSGSACHGTCQYPIYQSCPLNDPEGVRRGVVNPSQTINYLVLSVDNGNKFSMPLAIHNKR